MIDAIPSFKKYPNIYLGIGTIRTTEQVDLAINAGASFAITPGFSPKISDYASSKGLVLIPGVQLASEVMAPRQAGQKVLKFFPDELSGGIDKLNAFKSVCPDITFIPTGSITNKNIANYLNLDNVVAVGASSAMPESLIRSKSWDEITNNLLEIKIFLSNFPLMTLPSEFPINVWKFNFILEMPKLIRMGKKQPFTTEYPQSEPSAKRFGIPKMKKNIDWWEFRSFGH